MKTKTKTGNLLPKTMNGSVHTQFVRCGKTSCKCARGELHGAYYYHFVREDGKLKKRYLKATEVEQIEAACAARRANEKAQRERSRETWDALRQLRERLRDYLARMD